MGHAGTLDPMATGLLIVCIGKATKVVDWYVYNVFIRTRKFIILSLDSFLEPFLEQGFLFLLLSLDSFLHNFHKLENVFAGIRV